MLVVLAGLAAYANSFSGAFVLDDHSWIVENPALRRFGSAWVVALHSSRPVLILSLALNYRISGLQTWSYHAFNLLVHIAAALVLTEIVRRTLLRSWAHRITPVTAAVLAIVAGLLWAAHPLQTESVTYIIQRSESLMAVFYELVLLLVVIGAESRKSEYWYGAAVICCALAVMTKPVAVTAPIIVLLYDRCFLAGSWHEVFRKRWGLYVGLAMTWILLACLLWFAPSIEWRETAGSSIRISPLTYGLTETGVVLHYLRLAIWPYPLSLEYDWMPKTTIRDALPSLCLLSGLLFLWGWFARRRTGAAFLIASFVVILLPTSSFIPISDFVVEHRMYLPLALIIVAIVMTIYLGISKLRNHNRSLYKTSVALFAIFAAIAVASSVHTTRNRNLLYHSEIAILSDAVERHPLNARARINLAVALENNNRSADAESQLRDALAIKPDSAEAYANLGIVKYHAGNLDEAIANYERSITLNPHSAFTHSALGTALTDRGELDPALREQRAAVEIEPTSPDMHYNLGLAEARAGRLDAAIAEWERVLELEPGSARANNCLGIAASRTGQVQRAVEYWSRALASAPDDPAVGAELAWVLATAAAPNVRNGVVAVQVAERADRATGGRDVKVLQALAAAYAEQGRFADAVTKAREALRISAERQDSNETAALSRELSDYEQNRPFRDPELAGNVQAR